VERRLAAILMADVVGYSRLIGVDEAGTLAALRVLLKDLVEPTLKRHHGRVVKLMGDGLLAEFASVVNAVVAAVEIQEAILERSAHLPEDRRIVLRVGVNIGDVVVEDGDLFGDGVNIAARLQEVADPNGVAISDGAHRELRGKLELPFADAGEKDLKNIVEPVRAWLWSPTNSPGDAPASEQPLAETDKPSVAVLPFDNMSGDKEQEFFADGMTEDIITALSKHRWLRVIARNSTFKFKGKAVDIRQIAAELGANYVVEGSVRRSGQRLRITAQLIDAATGDHLWAERYDRSLEDIFDLQDEITDTIVGRIEPELGAAERHRVDRKPRTNLQAWDCFHLGMSHFYKFTVEGNLESRRLLKRSFELDPDFGDAYAWWAYSVVLGMVYWDTDPDETLLEEALAAANKALSIDGKNAIFFTIVARVALARRDYTGSLAGNKEAVRLNPTLAVAYCAMGDALAYEGQVDESIDQFEKAIALSPNDPQVWAFLTYGALALIFKEDFETALEWTERASVIPNRQYWTLAHMAVALAHIDRLKDAEQTVAKLIAEKPEFTCTFAEKKLFFIRRPEQLALYLDGLRKAGVPE